MLYNCCAGFTFYDCHSCAGDSTFTLWEEKTGILDTVNTSGTHGSYKDIPLLLVFYDSLSRDIWAYPDSQTTIKIVNDTMLVYEGKWINDVQRNIAHKKVTVIWGLEVIIKKGDIVKYLIKDAVFFIHRK